MVHHRLIINDPVLPFDNLALVDSDGKGIPNQLVNLTAPKLAVLSNFNAYYYPLQVK